MRNSKIIKLDKLDSQAKELEYLKNCLKLTPNERMLFLEELRQQAFQLIEANLDILNLYLPNSKDPYVTKPRLSRLIKTFRKI